MAEDAELRRMVEEAARAARAAQEAAERTAREQPSRIEDTLRGVSVLLDTLLRNLLFGVRQEFARLLSTLHRTLRLLQHAFWALVIATSFTLIAVVVLAVGVVQLLNALLQPPWGTLAAGLLFLAVGLLAALFVRGRIRAIGREADGLMRP